MNNFKMQVEVDPTEDTEWNDILREKGIIPERPKSPTQELEEALNEAILKQQENRLENKDLDELEELEDEEDEEFLEHYKRQRMEEMKKLTIAKKFGSVYPISKPEYKHEITDSSLKNFVFLHMSLQSNLQSRVLSSILSKVAPIFSEIKFCEITANRAVENYPELNCPTILIYHNGDVVKQYITLTQLGGNSTQQHDIEKVLVQIGAVKDNDKRLMINQDDDEDLRESHRLRFAKKSIRSNGISGTANASDDDDEDDFYD